MDGQETAAADSSNADVPSNLAQGASLDAVTLSEKTENDVQAIEDGMMFDESQMPVPGLVFVSEQDGYCYFDDPASKKQYSMDEGGFWYVYDDDRGEFISVDEPTKPVEQPQITTGGEELTQEILIKPREIAGITFDAMSFPVFPTNAKGQPVLPKDSREQPFFPVDEQGLPIFPYDHTTKKWTFPVDDTEEPIFPRNSFNKPLVPVDNDMRPIFPVDEKGVFIFPLDETNCPIPALTPDGRPVIPTDEFGNLVIPRDREGKPLIHIADDGITPMSLAEFKQWKENYRSNAKKMFFQEMQQQNQPQYPAVAAATAFSMFHPLNIQQYSTYQTNDVSMLQRSKRVRPEDIDLPIPSPTLEAFPPPCDTKSVSETNGNSALTNGKIQYEKLSFSKAPIVNESSTAADEEAEKAAKRKKLLSAQLNFSKKLPLRSAVATHRESVEQSDELTEKQRHQLLRQSAGFKDDEIAIKLGFGSSSGSSNRANDSSNHAIEKLPASNLKESYRPGSVNTTYSEEKSRKKDHRSSKHSKHHRSRSNSADTYDSRDSSYRKKSKKHRKRKRHSTRSGDEEYISGNDNGKEHGRKQQKVQHKSQPGTSLVFKEISAQVMNAVFGDDKPRKFKEEIHEDEYLIVDESLEKGKPTEEKYPNSARSRMSFSDNSQCRDDYELERSTGDRYSSQMVRDMEGRARCSPLEKLKEATDDSNDGDGGRRSQNDGRTGKSSSKRHKSSKKQGRSSEELENFDVNKLNEYSDLDFVHLLIKNTRKKYDDIKKKIAQMEEERNAEKEKLKKLFEVESRVEERLGVEYAPSTDDDEDVRNYRDAKSKYH